MVWNKDVLRSIRQGVEPACSARQNEKISEPASLAKETNDTLSSSPKA